MRGIHFYVRILFLNPVGFIGGAERVLLDVMASLRPVLPVGSSMHLICLSRGPLLEEAEKLGVSAEAVELPARLSAMGESGSGGKLAKTLGLGARLLRASPAGIAYLRRFRAAVLAAKADVIHSNGVKTHLLSRLLPKRAGRVVWHIHDLLGGRPLLSNVLRYTAGHVSAAIAISNAVAIDLQTVLPRCAVITILNGIDTDHFTPGSADGGLLDQKASLSKAPVETLRVGLIATYARWKGQDLFLEAAEKLDRSLPVRFYIVGGSIYHTAGSQFSRDELVAMAHSRGLNDRTGFISFEKDPLDIYRALDVVVHASTKPEPFGRTIAEAMACGRAVIVARAGGAVELFEEGISAVGFTPGDAGQLSETIRGLVSDADLRSRLGNAGRAMAIRQFARDRLGGQFLKAYAQLSSNFEAIISAPRS